MPLSIDTDRIAHDFDRGRVNFYAAYDGLEVKCAASDEAIQDISRISTYDVPELMNAFRAYAFEIQEIAERKYLAGLIEPDGYVIVKSADL